MTGKLTVPTFPTTPFILNTGAGVSRWDLLICLTILWIDGTEVLMTEETQVTRDFKILKIDLM